MSQPVPRQQGKISTFKRTFSSGILPVTQAQISSSGTSKAAPLTSSPERFIEGWSPSPPRQNTQWNASRVRIPLSPKSNTFSTVKKEKPKGGIIEKESVVVLNKKRKGEPAPWDLSNQPIKKSRAFREVGSLGSITDTFQSARDAMKRRESLTIRQKVMLSPQQQDVLQLVQRGESVFFTGSAGTGKSLLLREIISNLRKIHGDKVAITGTTGMAACNVGGITIHSFSGIGIGEGSAAFLLNEVRKNRRACGRWLRTKVLIIDEVSMLDGDLFDKLEYIAAQMRAKLKGNEQGKLFGGLQLIMTGDFFQLPPVSKSSKFKFCFEAEAWNKVINHTINLTQVFRQKDTEFVNMLNEMRHGQLSQRTIARFKELSRPLDFGDNIDATELFPRREEVERANQARLAALRMPAVTYVAEDSGTETEVTRNKMLDNMMCRKTLELKIGAQVMLIKNRTPDNENDPIELVNGSVGRIVEFCSKDGVSDDEDEEMKKFRKKRGGDEKLPRVEFKLPGGGTRTCLVDREEFKIEDQDGKTVKAKRKQIPLILAWAMSIHKSQGQTLDRVRVDLGKVFEKGQSYVALSRATSLDGLQVLRFDPKKVLAHPKVIAWNKTLTDTLG